MAINSTKQDTVAVQPIGTKAFVLGGYASQGGYNFSTSQTVPAGTYLVNIISNDVTSAFSFGGEDNASYVYPTNQVGGTTNVLKFTTTETRLGFAQYLTWTSVVSPNAGNGGLNSVVYGNGTWVIAGVNGNISTSTDAITWTSRNNAAMANNFNIQTVAYGNGTFVASAGSGPTLMTSTDNGVTWQTRTFGWATTIQAIAYGAGLFVASASSAIRTSTDGITWTSTATGTGTAVYNANLTYINSLFFYGNNNTSGNRYITSTDGITWVSRGNPGVTTPIFTYGQGKYIASGVPFSIASWSTDGINWVSRGTGITTATQARAVAYANGIFILAGDGGQAITSTDGNTWTARTIANGTNTVNDAKFANGITLTVAATGKASYSAMTPVQVSLYDATGVILN